MSRRRTAAPRPLAGILGILGGALIAVAVPLPLAAQGEGLLQERELEYSSARNAYQSALDATAAAQARQDRALEEWNAARSSGDSDRIDAAFSQFLATSRELRRQERRVSETGQALEDARRAYLLAVDDRLEDLYAEVARTQNRSQRADLASLIRDYDNTVRELERGVDWDAEFALVPLPEITFDQRDGPAELRGKAEFLQRRAQQYDAMLADIDDRINALQRRLRRERIRSDFMADLGRFDDTRMPVGTPRARGAETSPQSGGASAPPDSVAFADLTLEERIDILIEHRQQVERARTEVENRARLFLSRAGEVPA